MTITCEFCSEDITLKDIERGDTELGEDGNINHKSCNKDDNNP